jgi:ribosomal protein S8E
MKSTSNKIIGKKKKGLYNKKSLVLSSLNFTYRNKKNVKQNKMLRDPFFFSKNRIDLIMNLSTKHLFTINGNLEKKKSSSDLLKISNLKPVENKYTGNFFPNIKKTNLNFKKANVYIIKLDKTFCLDLLGIINSKKRQDKFVDNIQKGCILEVNASSLGLITKSGTLIYKIRAKVTNMPFRDGCINCVGINNFG